MFVFVKCNTRKHIAVLTYKIFHNFPKINFVRNVSHLKTIKYVMVFNKWQPETQKNTNQSDKSNVMFIFENVFWMNI